MRLHTGALSLVAALISMLAYVCGGILHVVSPWGAPALASYVFHVDVIELSVPFAWDSFIVGVVMFALVGAALGALTGWLYNTLVSHAAFGLTKTTVGSRA